MKRETSTDYSTSTCTYTSRSQRLLKFAVHNCNDQDNQHRNNRNRYNPICSHPIISLAQPQCATAIGVSDNIPTCHPPQRLDTPIHIPLALQQRLSRMLNRFPLHLQIRQRTPSNILRLVGNPLTLSQPVTTPIQSLRSGKQLLPLLELLVATRVVGVAVSEKGLAVVGEGFQFAFRGVEVGFVVAEAGVDTGAGGGGDVLFFNAHLVKLERILVKLPCEVCSLQRDDC